MILFFFFFLRTGQVSNTSLHMGWVRVLCSLPFALRVGWEEGKEESQGGSIPVYYEACLKTQPAHKILITRRGSFHLRGLLFFPSINHVTVGSFSIN